MLIEAGNEAGGAERSRKEIQGAAFLADKVQDSWVPKETIQGHSGLKWP